MFKSILVALDESKSSQCAKELGIQLAKTNKASLTGIGVVDEPWIAAPEAIPLGGAAFKVQLDEQFLKEAKRRIHKLEKAFEEESKKNGIDASIIDATGIPAYEIEEFVTEFDILIIGKDANFHFTNIEEAGISIRKLIKDNPRPVILTSETLPYEKSNNVLITYDGTLASSRALHMALLINVFKGKKVHLINVNTDEHAARDLVNTAAKLCKNHGIDVQTHPVVTHDSPAKVILQSIEDLKASLVVMGAYGHSGFISLFRGSCTKELIKSANTPLFIYH